VNKRTCNQYKKKISSGQKLVYIAKADYKKTQHTESIAHIKLMSQHSHSHS